MSAEGWQRFWGRGGGVAQIHQKDEFALFRLKAGDSFEHCVTNVCDLVHCGYAAPDLAGRAAGDL
ncbi:hypothetical protein KUV26_20830 [Leisingera daeponensis]|uniref:Uncharacterized protein n=1 Tax=Leisingera daeponensis TaxID=405746 RepID=A0ABS7NL32_9RHOB|nr:hypothetical protein [Leisingera daeponensis]MBY6141888.1 hypothetical protein [Leisingera daeponensis]